MKVVIPGGSGHVGTLLAHAFRRSGWDVVVLTRGGASDSKGGEGARTGTAPWRLRQWDGTSIGRWAEEIDGADVVINLAGRNVNCRYTTANLDAIMRSRVESTRVVGEAITRARRPPRIWLQASTATIYAHRFDAANDERTGIIGGNEPGVPAYWGFSVEVAKAWERALAEADTPRTRRVAMRAAIVMSPGRGGPFDLLLTLVRRGLGGAAAGGRQFVSWVHDADFIAAVEWLIARDDMEGAVNIAAPGALPNAEFMRTLRAAAGVRVGLPATGLMLRLGALLMRSDTELILKSRRVAPGRLLQSGFTFAFPEWNEAARDLVARASARSPRPSAAD